MNKKSLIFAALTLLLASTSNVHAQFNEYRIYLFDRAPNVILDSSGEFRLTRYSQSILELESDYIILNLDRQNLTIRVRKMTLTHVHNTRSGEIERSSVVLLDSATELSINLDGWSTMLVQETQLPDGSMYNTIYGRLEDRDKEVWKIIQPRTMAQ